MSTQFERDVERATRRLEKISTRAIESANTVWRIAARPLVNEIKRRAPVSDAPHSRYSGGKIVATYQPGNLRRSFKILRFQRSPALFIGPEVGKNTANDGYYAHFQEFGAPAAGVPPQPFVGPSAAAAGPDVLRIATKALKREIEITAKAFGR